MITMPIGHHILRVTGVSAPVYWNTLVLLLYVQGITVLIYKTALL